jgi:hypothetical protein
MTVYKRSFREQYKLYEASSLAFTSGNTIVAFLPFCDIRMYLPSGDFGGSISGPARENCSKHINIESKKAI